MKAAFLETYRNFIWKEISNPEIKKGEVLIRIQFASICGSDMHIFNGDFHPRTPIPFIPGHEMGGIVVETGEGVRGFDPGDKVAIDPIIWCGRCAACEQGHYPACTSLKLLGIDMDGGFCEYISVPSSMLYKAGKSIPDEHVALIEIYSVGFHANNRAGVKEGDTIAIWGAGRVGQVILQAARTKTQNTVFIVDVLDNRLAIASNHYANVVTINATRENPVDVIKAHTQNRGVDVAFEAVGHAQAIHDVPNPIRGCIQAIRGAGTVCVLGLSDEPVPVVFKEMIWKEAKLVASRVNHGEFAEVLTCLQQGLLKPEALISKVMKAAEIQSAFELLEREKENYLKVLLDFRD